LETFGLIRAQAIAYIHIVAERLSACDAMTMNLLTIYMRVRRAAQLTLPADVRQALNVKEGD